MLGSSRIRDDKSTHEEVPPVVRAIQEAMRLPQDEEKLPFALRSPPKPPVRMAGRRRLSTNDDKGGRSG